MDTLNEELIKPPMFANEPSRVLYAAVRPGLDDLKLTDLLAGEKALENLNPSLTVRALLESSRNDAISMLGNEEVLNRLTDTYVKVKQEAIKNAEILGANDGQVQELLTNVQNEVGSVADPATAIDNLIQKESTKPEPDTGLLAKLNAAQSLVRLGGNRIEVLEPLLRNPRP